MKNKKQGVTWFALWISILVMFMTTPILAQDYPTYVSLIDNLPDDWVSQGTAYTKVTVSGGLSGCLLEWGENDAASCLVHFPDCQTESCHTLKMVMEVTISAQSKTFKACEFDYNAVTKSGSFSFNQPWSNDKGDQMARCKVAIVPPYVFLFSSPQKS